MYRGRPVTQKSSRNGAVFSIEVCYGFIPPRCANANADVETFYRLIEDEFYTRERFGSMNDFLSKAFVLQSDQEKLIQTREIS